MSPNPGSTIGAVSLGLSVLFHVVAVVGVDSTPALRLTSPRQERMRAFDREKSLQFEFVEAPPQTAPAKLRATRKIAARDSESRDLTKDKSRALASSSPKIQAGPADQLAQRKKNAPMPAKLAKPAVSEEEKQPSKEKNSATAQPSPPIAGGTDVITARESSKRKSSGAAVYDVTSFEAMGSGMGEYMKRLKEKKSLSQD